MRAKTTILVIDDEPVHCDYAAVILRGAGFEVQTASGGKEGLACVAAGMPDLIFCDVMMPEMDGYEVLAQLRADAKTAKVPFVFFTAVRFKGARSEAKQSGADEYLLKPYKAEALLEIARRLLGASGEQVAKA